MSKCESKKKIVKLNTHKLWLCVWLVELDIFFCFCVYCSVFWIDWRMLAFCEYVSHPADSHWTINEMSNRTGKSLPPTATGLSMLEAEFVWSCPSHYQSPIPFWSESGNAEISFFGPNQVPPVCVLPCSCPPKQTFFTTKFGAKSLHHCNDNENRFLDDVSQFFPSFHHFLMFILMQ